MVSRARRPGTRKPAREYTEHALDDARRLIPRIVYLPARLRGHNQSLSLDGLQVRITGPQIIDNHARIQEADPLGFMIAKMHGLPIPRFIIECGAGGCPTPLACTAASHADFDPIIRVHYHTPSIAEQTQAARFLAARVTFRSPEAYSGPAHATSTQVLHAHDYDNMIRQAADRAAQSEDTDGDTE